MTRRKYTKELMEEVVKNSFSIADVMRKLGLVVSGGNYSHMSKRIKQYGLDTSHFTGMLWSKGKILGPKKTADQYLINNPEQENRSHNHILTKYLLNSNIKHLCAFCGCGNIWNNKPITLHIDHINGDWRDNRIENLRFLCPNCHSQTPTHGNRKRKQADMMER